MKRVLITGSIVVFLALAYSTLFCLTCASDAFGHCSEPPYNVKMIKLVFKNTVASVGCGIAVMAGSILLLLGKVVN